MESRIAPKFAFVWTIASWYTFWNHSLKSIHHRLKNSDESLSSFIQLNTVNKVNAPCKTQNSRIEREINSIKSLQLILKKIQIEHALAYALQRHAGLLICLIPLFCLSSFHSGDYKCENNLICALSSLKQTELDACLKSLETRDWPKVIQLWTRNWDCIQNRRWSLTEPWNTLRLLIIWSVIWNETIVIEGRLSNDVIHYFLQ